MIHSLELLDIYLREGPLPSKLDEALLKYDRPCLLHPKCTCGSDMQLVEDGQGYAPRIYSCPIGHRAMMQHPGSTIPEAPMSLLLGPDAIIALRMKANPIAVRMLMAHGNPDLAQLQAAWQVVHEEYTMYSIEVRLQAMLQAFPDFYPTREALLIEAGVPLSLIVGRFPKGV